MKTALETITIEDFMKMTDSFKQKLFNEYLRLEREGN